MIKPTNSVISTKTANAIAAFTLVELMLVLALFGLTAGIFISNFDLINESFFETKNPELILESAIAEVKLTAAKLNMQLNILIDKDKNEVVAKNVENGKVESTIKLPDFLKNNFACEFYECEYKDGFDGGYKSNGVSLNSINFAPDGTSNEAFIKFELNGETNWYRLNPFSGFLTKES